MIPVNRPVTAEDARPAGPADKCFYCRGAIGELHAAFCTMISDFPVTVSITDTRTGETRIYHTSEYEHEDGWDSYMWAEGNYSCDCNRYLFFQRAADQDEEDERECTDGRYRVNGIVRDSTGEVLYTELDGEGKK